MAKRKRLSIEALADYVMLHPQLSETACVKACGWAEGSVSKVLGRVRPIVAARKKKNSEQLDRKILKEQTLDIDFLDKSLRDAIDNEEGMARVQAIRTGYGRLGVVLDPESVPPAPPQNLPSVYSWLFQQKQQNASGESVTQTVAVEGKASPELPGAPPLLAPAIPLSRPRDRNDEILIEIEDYLRD